MIRNTRGFTLIELMIVTVVIGILVAIVVPSFTNLKTKSFDSESKSDIRNMLTAQEAYFAEYQAYATTSVPIGGRVDLDSDGKHDFQASAGVIVVVTAYSDGLQATAQHRNSPNTWCINSSATQSTGTPGAIVKQTSC